MAPATARRMAWRVAREGMEARKEKNTPRRLHRKRHWFLFKTLLRLFGVGLKATGLYARGARNALDIGLTRLDLSFEDLPAAFDGFRVLQLADPHLDGPPGILKAALELVSTVEADLCVLSGDYRFRTSGPIEPALVALAVLLPRIRARRGIVAVLGNHDSAAMVEPLEALGARVLLNETVTIDERGAQLHLTGTDDVHYFYTDEARAALEGAPEGFGIALVHSAELADVAADSGFRLYLAGHTHGGQVCLPGGRPIITHMSCHRRYASGLWRHGAMVGYTSTGIGTSALPVRFNTRGEVVLITLRRKPGGG